MYLVGAVAGGFICLLAWFLAAQLPPPADADDDVPVPDYPALVTRPRVLTTTALAAALGAGASTASVMTPLLMWTGVGIVLVAIDLATTYLPLRLHRVLTAAVVGGFIIDLSRNAWLRALVCGAVTGAFFWLVWRIGAALGFGDVRLAAWAGALAGAMSWQHAWVAVMGAAVVGAVHGLATSWWRRRHPSPFGTAFAYGPALWTGPWLALAALGG